jgi:hypothetical protein
MNSEGERSAPREMAQCLIRRPGSVRRVQMVIVERGM